MGLSLNNIYQRPYVQPDKRTPVRRKNDDEKSTAAQQTRQEEGTNQNSRSKGLQNIEQQQPTYVRPSSEQKFSLPAQNVYNNVNINYVKPKRNTQTNIEAADTTVQSTDTKTVDNQINIAQILKDFKNTAKAIGTPDDLSDIVDGYLSVVEKQVTTGNADKKLIKNTLGSAASVLDNYISETLNKDSQVVEKWVDALFLQNIDLNYNEDNINERFLVKFPDGSTSQTKKQEEAGIAAENAEISETEKTMETGNITAEVSEETSGSKVTVPSDKQLRTLFVQAKRYSDSDNPEEAIKLFEQALNRALETDDTETTGKIYYEVGKIYDSHDYVEQALRSYNQAAKLAADENVKTKAHYSMAQIYDEANQISPAMDHYFSTVSHAGEADNLPAQSASLTKIGNIYADMYEKEAFDYYDIAQDLADETENDNLKGYVASNTGRAYVKFDEPENALKSYSKAAKSYTDAETPQKTAQNYLAAADIMVGFNNIGKASNLLKKARGYASQTEDNELLNEINTKISQLQLIM